MDSSFNIRQSFAALVFCGLAAGLAGCGSEPGATKDEPEVASLTPASPTETGKPETDVTSPPRDAGSPPRKEKTVGDAIVKASAPKPQHVFRPSDDRPKHDDAALAKAGIHRYASNRLILYTDIDPKLAKTLPPVIDQVYPAWEAYFGKLPPDREQTPFQVTGYVMKDVQRFQDAGLIPADFPALPPGGGRHRGYRFWMHDSQWDYYRRHLLIHESTHCFMYATRDALFPTWYMEGMAEFFGTHERKSEIGGRRTEVGKTKTSGTGPTSDLRPPILRFGIMPQRFEDFVGSGRMEFVQQDCAAGRPLSLAEVVSLKPADFRHNQAYAWSWALCKFLDSHPRYGKSFRALRTLESATAFRTAFATFVRKESPQILAEWHLFARGLVYGYDAERSAIAIRPGKPPGELTLPLAFDLQTNRGWQSSGVWLDKGDSIHITAAGRFELAQKPKPWISEPQGISFTYFQGRPLGEVTAVIVPDSTRSLPLATSPLPMTPIGRGAVLKAAIKGTVYLRVNDSFAWLEDNKGTVKVTIDRDDSRREP